MGHCLRFVVTSRALCSVGDIHVVQMLIKPYVPSDKLEGLFIGLFIGFHLKYMTFFVNRRYPV